tara:strand:+ start:53792 stop:54499 length:708 start_codon:yes stop_codon:yes gene_type:complete
MYKSKIIVIFITLTFVLFGISQFLANETICRYTRAFILPLFALLYFVSVKRKTLFFILFLVSYSVSDLMELSDGFIPYFTYYFLGNSLYVLAYVFLLLEICKSVSLFHVIKNYKVHVVVLVALNIYIVYVLQIIINPYTEYGNQYYLELTYNIIMLLLLSGALMNYFYRDNRKSLFLFIGSLCIVFSEVINVAYLYIAETNTLNFLSTSLAVLAFYFYYQQSKLENSEASRLVTQ